MSTLYPGILASVSRPFDILDAMWLAFGTLANTNKKTPAINGENVILLACYIDGCAVIRPVGAPARQ